MKRIALVFTVIMFYMLILGYGYFAIPTMLHTSTLKGSILVMLLVIALGYWSKISYTIIFRKNNQNQSK